MHRTPLVVSLIVAVTAGVAFAKDPSPPHTATFGAGPGPRVVGDVIHLLDEAGTKGQSNAVAYDATSDDAFLNWSVRANLRVNRGGDGGAFVFLNVKHYGARGPAPFVPSWVEPNLKETFAVGIDVHNPKNEEPFGPWGNYLGRPQREVSLHFDGREVVKRVAETEFRDKDVALAIDVQFVTGGANVSVFIADHPVYEEYFIAHMHPYACRLALGAGTREDVATRFDVTQVSFNTTDVAPRNRQPFVTELFHHVMTDNSKTSYETEVELPPPEWAFGRVILTLDIHDGGTMWDEWDRNGEVSVFDDSGRKLGIVPFITSYRTPCHWKVDVTHFRPLLTGKRKFVIAAGTTFYKNRGYLMSATLSFHPPSVAGDNSTLVPHRVVPLWVGSARYKSDENHFRDFFTPQTVAIDETAKAARVFTTTTGHSQVGEFTPSQRTLVFETQGGDKDSIVRRFENVLWKTDCYLNPNRPQLGTWKYARAGWAPGDVVRPWWVDLTPHLPNASDASRSFTLRYEPSRYEFPEGKAPKQREINKASHVVRSYLILYGSPKAQIPAPILRIAQVVKNSNAAKSGVKRGDYLAVYDGTRIEAIDDLRTAIQAAVKAEKKSVPVVVYRGAERVELELAPGRMGVSLR